MVKSRDIDKAILAQKGLSDEQKAVFLRISKQTSFRQYAKKSDEHLKKIITKVKKEVKEWYNKKGEREDKRGFERPKQKGTTKPQMKKKIKEEKKENIPVKTKTKKANLPKVPKEVRQKIAKEKRAEYRKAYNKRQDVKEANRLRKAKARAKDKE